MSNLRISVTPSNIDPDILFQEGPGTAARVRTTELRPWIARTDLNLVRIRDRSLIDLNKPILQDIQYAYQPTEIAQALLFRQQPGVRVNYAIDEAPHGDYDIQSVVLELRYRGATPGLPRTVVSSVPAPT